MTILIAGASGATGQLLTHELLDRGHQIKAIVRSSESLPDNLRNHDSLSIIHATILEISNEELKQHLSGCTAVASCLGHNLTLKGIYGSPRKLVTDVTRRLCEAIRVSQPQNPVKFILMNTAGSSNHDLDEPISFGQRCVVGLIRLLLPPHADNEQAVDYLRTHGSVNDKSVDWVVVRPDTLIDQARSSEYVLYPSPTRSAIFNPGKTSRINVAHFMADLITNDDTWGRWEGRMPVIYNTDFSEPNNLNR